MKPHWVVYCICFHIIVLFISNNCLMYYDFFFACTFIFTGAEAESQTLAHDLKNKPVRQIFSFQLFQIHPPSNVLRLNMQRNIGDLLIRLCLCLSDIYNNLAAFAYTSCNEVFSITTSRMLYCCFHHCNLLTFDL